jgi:hypothetical protein
LNGVTAFSAAVASVVVELVVPLVLVDPLVPVDPVVEAVVDDDVVEFADVAPALARMGVSDAATSLAMRLRSARASEDSSTFSRPACA